MNAEQLNSARLARWSQNGEARLTLEAAAEWLGTIGFCPCLPLGVKGAAPAPSFVEAVVGRPAQIPSAGERSRANELVARMIENSAAVPLKLGHSLGEQPDFIASPEVLRYIYALRGDRNFKAGPSTVGNDKVTLLALHCWQAIERQGALDVAALQPILGRDITEAAIARALQELWIGLYVFPVLSAIGDAAKWELLSRRFPGQVTAGASTGQAESQSAMVSLYLYAVAAAAEEEILAYLSPLAPQSKLREVIRGLGSMRQLDIIDIGGRAHVCLQGGLLPEMVAQLSEEQLAVSDVAAKGVTSETATAGVFEGGIEIEREPLLTQQDRPGLRGDSDKVKKFEPKKFVPKKFVPRNTETGKSTGKRFDARASGAGGKGRFLGSRSSGGRYGGVVPSRPRSFAASAGDGAGPGGRGPDDRKPSTRGFGERARRLEKSGEGAGRRVDGGRKFERRPSFKSSGFKSAGSGPPKPWASKNPHSSGESAKPWMKRASFGPGGGAPRGRDAEERPRRWQNAGEGPGGSGSGYKKPYTKKPSGFKSAEFKPWGAKSGGRKPSGFTASGFKSAGARSREGKVPGSKPWVSKGAESRVGSAKSYAARSSRTSGGAAPRRPGKPYEGAEGAKTWKKRAGFEKPDSKNAGPGRIGADDKPKRWEKADAASGAKAGAKADEKRNSKPFWAKNPRGGKGSVAASRTNRPRGGKKSDGKKSGKKK